MRAPCVLLRPPPLPLLLLLLLLLFIHSFRAVIHSFIHHFFPPLTHSHASSSREYVNGRTEGDSCGEPPVLLICLRTICLFWGIFVLAGLVCVCVRVHWVCICVNVCVGGGGLGLGDSGVHCVPWV